MTYRSNGESVKYLIGQSDELAKWLNDLIVFGLNDSAAK